MNIINSIQKFFKEVLAEMKEVSWPKKQELKDSTWIVIVSTAFVGIFIGLTDLCLSNILGYFIR